MKNKKALIITLLIILIIAIAIVGVIIYSNTPKENAQQVLAKYFSLINEKKYEELDSYLTAESKNNCIHYAFNIDENKYYAISNGEIREISKNTYQIALEQAKLKCQGAAC